MAVILIFLALTGHFCDPNLCYNIEHYSYVTHDINEFIQLHCQQISDLKILRADDQCASVPFLLEIEFIHPQPVCYKNTDKYPNLEQPELIQETDLSDGLLILVSIFVLIYALCYEPNTRNVYQKRRVRATPYRNRRYVYVR